MKIVTAENYTDMSRIAADFILQRVTGQGKLTLGLATGSTPIGTYDFLIKDHQKNDTSYQHVSTFNLDEYIGMDPADPNSYHYFMNEKLFQHIDIPKHQIHLPNGQADDLAQECENFERKIEEAGGIDLQLLGLGGNGHIGFNEPGTSFEAVTHVVDLAEATRKANARFFDSLEEVPKQAITMGIHTIMKSREILLLVSGKRKSKALSRFLTGEIDSSFPSSILKKHHHVTVIADRDALQDTDTARYSDSE